MDLDDPNKPEFASWRSYRAFEKRIRHSRRYVWDMEVQAFMDTVVSTIGDRVRQIEQGTILFRGQLGAKYDTVVDEDGNEIGEETHGFGPERMRPLADRAREGRVNPAGIPVLYLASSEQTAISEVRPWIGSDVSLAHCKILRDLRAIDLSLGHGEMSFGHLTMAGLVGEETIDANAKQKAVWIDIDNAFSEPITLADDTADYVPTQILAELFRNTEYDAIIYRSQFGKKGYNVALFNIEDAEAFTCAPCRVKGIEVEFEEIGNRWYSQKHRDANEGESA